VQTQNNLGNALLALGQRENGTAHLEEAAASYRAALQGGTRDLIPLGWAVTQNNLGRVLSRLGEREVGPARLEEAEKAYRAALEVWSRELAPSQWAETQSNLGRVLRAMAPWRAARSSRKRRGRVRSGASTDEILGPRLPPPQAHPAPRRKLPLVRPVGEGTRRADGHHAFGVRGNHGFRDWRSARAELGRGGVRARMARSN
jgi:tetratricopeptide (TPR) repeat protein